jgi:hypothetical protein
MRPGAVNIDAVSHVGVRVSLDGCKVVRFLVFLNGAGQVCHGQEKRAPHE